MKMQTIICFSLLCGVMITGGRSSIGYAQPSSLEHSKTQSSAKWSPDKKYYAVIGEMEKKEVILRIYNADDTFVKNIFTGLQWENVTLEDIFDWAHDIDHHYVFSSSANGQDDDLYLGNVESAEVWPLTKDSASELSPRLSPDDRYLAYLKEGDLYLMDVDWKEQKIQSPFRLTFDPDSPDLDPSWNSSLIWGGTREIKFLKSSAKGEGYKTLSFHFNEGNFPKDYLENREDYLAEHILNAEDFHKDIGYLQASLPAEEEAIALESSAEFDGPTNPKGDPILFKGANNNIWKLNRLYQMYKKKMKELFNKNVRAPVDAFIGLEGFVLLLKLNGCNCDAQKVQVKHNSNRVWFSPAPFSQGSD